MTHHEQCIKHDYGFKGFHETANWLQHCEGSFPEKKKKTTVRTAFRGNVQMSHVFDRKYPKNMWTQYEPQELTEEEKENILQSENLKNFLSSSIGR